MRTAFIADLCGIASRTHKEMFLPQQKTDIRWPKLR